MNLEPIRSFIQGCLGFDPAATGPQRWQETLSRRIQAVGASSPEDYLACLRHDAAELDALINQLTIKETYFYREPQHLRLLADSLVPERLASRPDPKPLRILSVGCATGEEPYSLLIALHERYGPIAERLFRVTACDIDRQAIEQAQGGIYRGLSFRALDPELQARYFQDLGAGRFLIRDDLRRAVRFRTLNLLADPYPLDLAGQDLIFFRNVSIYFPTETRRQMLGRLKEWLLPGGYLIVGLSETLANDLGVLPLRERDGLFLFVNEERAVADRSPVALATTSLLFDPFCPRAVEDRGQHLAPLPRHGVRPCQFATGIEREADTPSISTDSHPSSQLATSRLDTEPMDDRRAQALALIRSERHAEALAQLEPLCAIPDPDPADLVLKACLLYAQGQVGAAANLVQQALARDPWSVGALLLASSLAWDAGRFEEAIACLRRAIYHQPDHWAAHLQLAEAYRATDQVEQARREYQIVLGQLERAPQPLAPGLELIGLPSLPPGDLRALCRLRLERCRRRAD